MTYGPLASGNMWRWSFDRAYPGDMWLADDGNSNRDEVNFVTPAGKPKEALTSVGNVMKATRFTILPGACPSTN